ncbi:MAG: hypothetical protein HQL14_02760 [Candidatus Omnitrophica bacterium]|nr:hypothetical protein [Candidatus Omnitrophota bacterium]
MWVSSDWGAHWSQTYPDPNGTDQYWYTAASSGDGSHLIVGEYSNSGGNRGRLFFSADGGATWNETQPAGVSEQNWTFVTVSNDGSRYMAGIYGGLLYTGVLSGGIISWTSSGLNGLWEFGASSGDASHLFAGALIGRLYLGTLSGGVYSWSETQPAGAVNYGWTTGAMSSDASHLIAGISGGQVFVSMNGGANWSETKPVIDQNWNCVASSGDGKYLMAGHDQRLYRSINGGATWSEIQPSGNFNRNWNLSASSSDGTILLAGYSNGHLYFSTNGTTATPSWSLTTPPGNVLKPWQTGAIATDNKHMIVGSYANQGRLYTGTLAAGVITWTEAGTAAIGVRRDWVTTAISGDGTYVMAGNNFDWDGFAGRLYLGILTGGVYSWSEIRPSGLNADLDWNVTAMSADGSIMMAAAATGTNPGGLYFSYDGGAHWTSPTDYWISTWSDQSWATGVMSSDGNYIVVGDDLSLYESTDAGITWSPSNLPADLYNAGYSFSAAAGSSDASHLIAESSGFGLYVSAIGGKASNLTQVQNLTQVTF